MYLLIIIIILIIIILYLLFFKKQSITNCNCNCDKCELENKKLTKENEKLLIQNNNLIVKQTKFYIKIKDDNKNVIFDKILKFSLTDKFFIKIKETNTENIFSLVPFNQCDKEIVVVYKIPNNEVSILFLDEKEFTELYDKIQTTPVPRQAHISLLFLEKNKYDCNLFFNVIYDSVNRFYITFDNNVFNTEVNNHENKKYFFQLNE